jgi:anti-sigma B factor antagonist
MKTSRRMAGDVAVISLSGKLMGGPDAESMHQVIRETLDGQVLKIVIDVSEVSWVNSTGLGILIASHVTAASAGATMKLSGVSSRIRQIFMVTRLHTVFENHETVEAALRSFAP